MRRFVWPVAERLEASRPVKAPCRIHRWMLGTLPGILTTQLFSLRSGQRAQPFARRVDVNAEGFLQHRQIPVAGNDRVAFRLPNAASMNLLSLGSRHTFS